MELLAEESQKRGLNTKKNGPSTGFSQGNEVQIRPLYIILAVLEVRSTWLMERVLIRSEDEWHWQELELQSSAFASQSSEGIMSVCLSIYAF